jgi:hypothetical protein
MLLYVTLHKHLKTLSPSLISATPSSAMLPLTDRITALKLELNYVNGAVIHVFLVILNRKFVNVKRANGKIIVGLCYGPNLFSYSVVFYSSYMLFLIK